ncbi:MAG: glucuronosyltransferase [Candidatus Omnitrophica bacterium]|nr:glucuronosyltransferase [Candidatus Omnitrophota bacterium]
MIFVTVGAQMPFNRLVEAVDQWAGETGREDIFAQIGPTDWRPGYIQWTKFLDSAQFFEKFDAADTIVAHAGMGTILSALVRGKSILVMPRQGSLRETRNDHQVATAKRLLDLGKVEVAFDEKELLEKLQAIDRLKKPSPIGPYASPDLIEAIQRFVRES